MSAAAKLRDLLRPAPRTQNLAILLSDMKNFTARTSRQTREENARMLALHDALLVPVVRGFGGRKVKAIGDALLVAFKSPTDSVLCAMAMQDRLASWNARAPEADRIEVRIAVSLGEVQVNADDLAGDPVQLALRAALYSDAGEVVLTESVYLAMNKSEVPTDPFNVRELRPGETRLHRARVVGTRELPYAGRALSRLGKLPPPRLPILPRVAAAMVRAWPAIALAALAGLGITAVWKVRTDKDRDPVTRAEQLLAQKAPLAALAELDKITDPHRTKTAAVAALRGKAEHAVGWVGMAFADFAAAIDDDATVADAEVVRALVDDLDSDAFPVQWRPALVRTLGEKIGGPASDAVRALIASKRGKARRDALEVLELMGRATDEDRISVATSDLQDKAASCPAVLSAVRVLGIAANDRAIDLLKQTSAETKRCGAREAKDALRRIERGVVKATGSAGTATAASSATRSSLTATAGAAAPAAPH